MSKLFVKNCTLRHLNNVPNRIKNTVAEYTNKSPPSSFENWCFVYKIIEHLNLFKIFGKLVQEELVIVSDSMSNLSIFKLLDCMMLL